VHAARKIALLNHMLHRGGATRPVSLSTGAPCQSSKRPGAAALAAARTGSAHSCDAGGDEGRAAAAPRPVSLSAGAPDQKFKRPRYHNVLIRRAPQPARPAQASAVCRARRARA